MSKEEPDSPAEIFRRDTHDPGAERQRALRLSFAATVEVTDRKAQATFGVD